MPTMTRGGLRLRHVVAVGVLALLGVSVGIYAYDQEFPYDLDVFWADHSAVAAITWTDGGVLHPAEGHGGHWGVSVAAAHRYALVSISAALAPKGPITCVIKYKGATVDGPRTGVGVHCQTSAVG